MSSCDIGLIGLAVMGENLILNPMSKRFRDRIYHRTTAVTEKFAERRMRGSSIRSAGGQWHDRPCRYEPK